jgi:hypothetical protein
MSNNGPAGAEPEKLSVITVTDFDGLYDEECEGVRYDINDRSRHGCGFWNTHAWVNASLGWKRQDGKRHVSIEIGESGSGGFYGSVRLCRKCKLIDCFHWWDKENVYEIWYDKYYSETRSVKHCCRCGRRISLGGCGECHPSVRAVALVNEVMEECRKAKEEKLKEEAEEVRKQWEDLGGVVGTPIFGTTVLSGPSFGSGFFVELPVIISRMLDNQSEGVVREYIRECCKDGICRLNDDLRIFPPRGKT